MTGGVRHDRLLNVELPAHVGRLLPDVHAATGTDDAATGLYLPADIRADVSGADVSAQAVSNFDCGLRLV